MALKYRMKNSAGEHLNLDRWAQMLGQGSL